jgi:hypothetical protein
MKVKSNVKAGLELTVKTANNTDVSVKTSSTVDLSFKFP